MRADELERKIQKNIKSHLNQKDLLNLCSYLNIQITGRKVHIQDKLLESIKSLNYNTLLMISTQIDEYIKSNASKSKQITSQKVLDIPRFETSSSIYSTEKFTDNVLKSAPVDLEFEIPVNCRTDLVLPNVSSAFNNQSTIVPTQLVAGVNERVHNVKIPNVLHKVQIATSPFYCCSICLHPLSLLMPCNPNVLQNARNNSKSNFTFTLSENVKHILNINQQKINNKPDYKWQVLLRFVGIEPVKGVPTPDDKVTETIPPYLQVVVNNMSQPLWEILPSNCRAKEGKRHAKPVQVSDKLTDTYRTNPGYKQTINVSWMQTPDVYMYYYMGIYLERKLTVKEIMNLFISNRHINTRSIEETLKLIQSKLGDPSKNIRKDNDDDDDLVISNVLPINLCCPVGKSRIEIPLRTITCQHLQCFDAHLFLSMNERRPVWKCPVCDNRATPDDLFCDKFFDKILKHFKDDDEVTDVNVHPDHSFVAMKRSKDHGDRDNTDKITNQETSSHKEIKDVCHQDLIVLDSDDEAEIEETKKSNTTSLPPLLTPSNKVSREEMESSPDIRKKTGNTPSSTTPVHIQVCTDDSIVSEIERRNIAQKSMSNGIIPQLAAPARNLYTPVCTTNTSSKSSSTLSSSNITNNNTANNTNNNTANNTNNNYPLFNETSVSSRSGGEVSPKNVQTTSPVLSSSLPTTTTPTLHKPPMNPSPVVQSPTVSIPLTATTTNNRVLTTVPTALGAPISVIASINKSTLPTPSLPSKSSVTTNTASYTPKKSTTSYADIESSDVEKTSKELDISSKTSVIVPSTTNSLQTPYGTRNTLFAKSRFDSPVYNTAISESLSPLQNSSTPTLSSPITLSKNKDNTKVNNSELASTNLNVVKTLPVSVTKTPVNKNNADRNSPEPIACPGIVFQDSSLLIDNSKELITPKNADDNPILSTPPIDNKNESLKRTKIFKSKIPPPASSIAIPELSIDLTSEDDEASPLPQKPAINSFNKFGSTFNNNNVKWVTVNQPITNNMRLNPSTLHQLPLNANRFSSNNKTSDPAVNHYKPHQYKNYKQQQPIDLTGDDEDEDRSRAKRSKLCSDLKSKEETEDGQFYDNSSSSSQDSLMPYKSLAKKNVASNI